MTSQGLASGDVNRDAQPLRFMIHEGVPVVLVQSFDTVSSVSLVVSHVADTADDGDLCRQSVDRLGSRQEHGRESQSQLAITSDCEGNVSPSITLGCACRSRYLVESEIVHRLVSPAVFYL